MKAKIERKWYIILNLWFVDGDSKQLKIFTGLAEKWHKTATTDTSIAKWTSPVSKKFFHSREDSTRHSLVFNNLQNTNKIPTPLITIAQHIGQRVLYELRWNRYSFNNTSHYLWIDVAFERIFKPISLLQGRCVCNFQKALDVQMKRIGSTIAWSQEQQKKRTKHRTYTRGGKTSV